MKIGDKVLFTGADEDQIKWGNNDNPYKKGLKEGEVYTVKDIEVHSWHTKVYLEEKEGKFNSVSFSVQA